MKDTAALAWVGFLLAYYYLPDSTEIRFRGVILFAAFLGAIAVPCFLLARKIIGFGAENYAMECRSTRQVAVDLAWRIVISGITILILKFVVDLETILAAGDSTLINLFLAHILAGFLLLSYVRYNFGKEGKGRKDD